MVLNKRLYLIILVVMLILSMVAHYMVDSLMGFKTTILFYVPLFLLFIPNILYLIDQRWNILSQKPLVILFSGYLLGVLGVMIVGVYRLLDLGNVYTLISLTTYIIYKVVVLGLIISGTIWYIVDGVASTEENVYYGLIALSFSLYILSPWIGFYSYSDSVYGVVAPFLNIRVFFDYLFTDIFTFLVIVSFPFGVYGKYKLLEIDNL